MRTTLAVLGLLCLAGLAADENLGLFTSHGDIGANLQPGSAAFEPAAAEYRISGGGANIWGYEDAFHYVWKQMSGDMAITADVHFPTEGGNAHRKAGLMIRQSLDANAPYADAIVHGSGLASLQFRTVPGAMNLQVVSMEKKPTRIRLERKANTFMLYAGNPGEELKAAGPASIAMIDPVYVGLAVCAHDAKALETAVFSNVKIGLPEPARPKVRSLVSVYSLADKSTHVIYTADQLFEAPNWSPDGKYLLVNSGGNLYKLAVDAPAPKPEKMDLGAIHGINNDHGISSDGKLIALSATSGGAPASQVYVAGSDGSNPHLMTPKSPSYYHGWSPDGRWLAFVGQRDKNFDIYRIPVSGGEEQRLTTNPQQDDGPDYSPDGKWIYINSNRTGQFQIWRFPAAGAGAGDAKAERVTNDGLEDWFPHPSPDGKWMLFLSFPKGTQGHPANQPVELRMQPLPGIRIKPAKIDVLASLFGGQGTLNVNSWAPDSRRFAFVSYELLPPAK